MSAVLVAIGRMALPYIRVVREVVALVVVVVIVVDMWDGLVALAAEVLVGVGGQG